MIGRYLLAPFFGTETSLAHRARKLMRFRAAAIWIAFAGIIAIGCMPPPQPAKIKSAGIELSAVDVGEVLRGIPAEFGGARNEWIGFAIRAGQLPSGRSWQLRVSDLRTGDDSAISADNYTLYQLASVPVDTNSAEFVRETGATVGTAAYPRALVPANTKDGAMPLPADGLTWLDIHIPLAATPGQYSATIDVIESGRAGPIGSIPLTVTVYNFTLPEERHLHIVGDVSWDTFTRLYGERFVNLEPRLLSREDEKAAPAVAVLDSLMSMAHENRLMVRIPELSPTVKWPVGKAPLVEWDEYDSVVAPWAEGADYWPGPRPEGLERFDRTSQSAYEQLVAQHFSQKKWIGDFRSREAVATRATLISESDARHLAWTPQSGSDDFIRFDDVAPRINNPREIARIGHAAWFYPGGWFGTFGVIPTIQTKWLRQAEQDAEYLRLARDRGITQATTLTRIIDRPDGAASAQDWQRARQLIARMIEHGHGETITLDDDRTAWLEPSARAHLAPRETRWSMDQGKLHLALGVDVTRVAEGWSEGGELSWSEPPLGWLIDPSATAVPSLPAGAATRASLSASFDMDHILGVTRESADVRFVDGHSQKHSNARIVIPIAVSLRRPVPIALDAELNEWDTSDAIWEAPLTRFADRPTSSRGQVAPAAEPSAIYTTWTTQNFYVAFKVPAAGATRRPARNFVEYQAGRAWGEDLCEILVRVPGGSPLHVVCKSGATLVERKSGDTWTAVSNTVTPYAANIANNEWSGELAIPWREILPTGTAIPGYLEFNFSTHRDATGESASWAAPVDSGRDEHFTGALILRDPSQ